MFVSNHSTLRSLDILAKSLDASTMRSKIIANNIANAEVPNFKKSEVIFEAALKRNLAQEATNKISFPQLTSSHPQHISAPNTPSYKSITPSIHVDYNSIVNNNGNNVELEEEVIQMTKNQLQYSFIVDRLRNHFTNLSQWIRTA